MGGRDYWVHRHAKPKSYIETKNFCRILHMKMPQLLFFFFFFFSSRFSSFCFLPLFSTLEISDSSKAELQKLISFLFHRQTDRFLSLNRRPLNIGIILLTEKPQRGAAYRYVWTAHKTMSVQICPNVCQYF